MILVDDNVFKKIGSEIIFISLKIWPEIVKTGEFITNMWDKVDHSASSNIMGYVTI